MSGFEIKSLCVLGRQPLLGMAELESLYGDEHIKPIAGAAVLDVPAEEIDFKRLGGTIKTARVLAILPSSDWPSAFRYLRQKIPEHMEHLPEGKFTLGVSVYGLAVNVGRLNADLLEIKKIIKQGGRPIRIVPNKAPELNSAQVLHNNLTRRGAWELLLVRDGGKTILAQTLFVQDIDAYAARDQARPKRDARVGMLPPKLAQIIVNLATGPIELQTQSSESSGVQGADEQRTELYRDDTAKEQTQSATQQSAESPSRVSGSAGKQARAVRVLDPFCGTGVILQEAMLMGYHALGTDIEPRMAEYTKTNLEWLVEQYPSIETSAAVDVGDATSYIWPRFSAVASEVYLGRPLASLPPSDKLQEIINDANTITKKFLKNLAGQLKTGQKVCLAVPAWRLPPPPRNKYRDSIVNGSAAGQAGAARYVWHLPVIDHLTDMGYNYLDLKHVSRAELIYFREDQLVARRLLRFEKA